LACVIELPSPNHAARQSAVDMLVLHYTEMPLDGSLKILCDGKRPNRVSAHYVLAEDGTVYRLVPEDRVAWHAGASYWRGREALNGTSIGIEIVNLHGDRHDYPDVQIAALLELCRDIVGRHPAIEPRNVVGHSDIAPKRKDDPGLRFPWAKLAEGGIGLWPRRGAAPLGGDIQVALQRFGYPRAIDVTTADIVASFQRRFRPAKADGIADDETRALLADLLDQVGHEA
jgi:N-acetylmuramoyl-L-alanine amidase